MRKRYFYAAAGVFVMLFAGFVYAWSILATPIAADYPAWSNAQLSLAFTLCISFFCLGGLAAGLLSRRVPFRVNMVISALLFLTGFYMTSLTNSLGMLYVCYGVLCGTAAGFAYNSILNAVPQWFPDQQGTISGVLLMGFGAGSLVIGFLFSAITPDGAGGWRMPLRCIGVLMALIVLAGALVIRPPGRNDPSRKVDSSAASAGLELTPVKMLSRPSFWLFYLWLVLISAAGLVVIGQAKPLAQIAAPGLEAGTISLLVGMISVCNGVGRVVFGFLLDKAGRRGAVFTICLTLVFGSVLLSIAVHGRRIWFLLAAFILIGLGYGGSPTMCAAVTKQFYGQRSYAANFSLMNTNLLVASFASTLSGAIYDSTGSYTPVFALIFGFVSAALLLQFFVRKA